MLPAAPTEATGQPGERSREPDDAAATCQAVTGPITPAAPNRAVTAVVAAPNAASTSRHGDPVAFGTAWSTPASRASSAAAGDVVDQTSGTRRATKAGAKEAKVAATTSGPTVPSGAARPAK